LNVLHIGNNSLERCPLFAPVATSNTATPSRPPLAFSRFANIADRPAQASSDRALEVLGINPTDALTNIAREQNILRVNMIAPLVCDIGDGFGRAKSELGFAKTRAAGECSTATAGRPLNRFSLWTYRFIGIICRRSRISSETCEFPKTISSRS
jgi:hypothetical protein